MSLSSPLHHWIWVGGDEEIQQQDYYYVILERDNRPADDGGMSAGTVPLSLTEVLHQRQDGCWVRQLS